MVGFGRKAQTNNTKASSNSKSGEKKASKFNPISGLFANEGKNYLSAKIKEEVVIPAGSKIFLFENDREDSKVACNLTYVLPEADNDK